MPVYNQGDPRQKIQRCVLCDDPTGSCEEDHAYNYPGNCDDERIGPVCPACYEFKEFEEESAK